MPRSATLCILLGLTVYAVARSLAYAYTRPFWIDEFLTQAVCHQPNLEAVRKVLNQGMDGMPPFFYLIERIVASLFSNEEIGWRFLSVLGFACTLILVFVFVKTRNGRMPALISASLLLMTPLFTYYAAEARPYTLLTACVAFALVCYQRAPASLWVGECLSVCSSHPRSTIMQCFRGSVSSRRDNSGLPHQTNTEYSLARIVLGIGASNRFLTTALANEADLMHSWSRLYPHSFGTTYAVLWSWVCVDHGIRRDRIAGDIS